MSLERASTRIVIAGASSLLGAELKSLLEQSRFAVSDFRLLDEEMAAGTLTEAGGEAVVIQPVEEDSFKRARFVFFTGSPAFTKANLDLALRSGALVIDLSGHSASVGEAVPWFRGFDSLHGQLSAADTQSKLVSIPSAAAEAIVRMAFGLADLRLRALTATVLQPVSAWGRFAIEELDEQAAVVSADGNGVVQCADRIQHDGPVRREEPIRFAGRGSESACRSDFVLAWQRGCAGDSVGARSRVLRDDFFSLCRVGSDYRCERSGIRDQSCGILCASSGRSAEQYQRRGRNSD
jgi:aspartate-semialdehyde dehydrogenase